MLGTAVAVTATNTSVGLALVTVARADAAAAAFLVVPALTVFAAYRAYTGERQKHESLEFLYEATRTLSRSREVVPALGDLLAKTLDTFRAELAEIVLFSPEPGQP